MIVHSAGSDKFFGTVDIASTEPYSGIIKRNINTINDWFLKKTTLMRQQQAALPVSKSTVFCL